MKSRLLRWWLSSAMLVPLLAAQPSVMQAQNPDSMTFRSGQWGAEFSLAGSFAGLGVQRFSTPTRAWVASVRGRLQDVSGDTDSLGSSLFGVAIAQLELEQAALTLGHRWYRPLTQNVLQHVTVGALASTSQNTFWNRASPDVKSRLVSAGVFAELGAMWMVTPRLSLGAAWAAQATRGRSTATNFLLAGSETRRTTTSFAFGDVRMQGSLFF